MTRAAADAPRIEIRSRDDLRAWLSVPHAAGAGAHWPVLRKKHAARHVPLVGVVEKLLCRCWIDSVPHALDADRSKLLMAARNPGSALSAVNRDHVARARARGATTAAGEAAIAAAHANGMWQFLDDVERLDVPDDLAIVQGIARPTRDVFPRSLRRGALEWLKTARRPATRSARIADIAESASAGQRPRPFRR